MENNDKNLENLEPKAGLGSAPKIDSRILAKNSWLSDHEAVKSEKDKIILPSMIKGSHLVRNLVLIILLAGLCYGGYLAYTRYETQIVDFITRVRTGNSLPVANSGVPSAAEDQGAQADVPSDNPAAAATSTPAAAATSTPPAQAVPPASGKRLTVNDNSLGYLNVRSEPAASGKLVTKIHPGETFSYTDSKYDWYLITLSDGRTGWVSGQYVTVGK